MQVLTRCNLEEHIPTFREIVKVLRYIESHKNDFGTAQDLIRIREPLETHLNEMKQNRAKYFNKECRDALFQVHAHINYIRGENIIPVKGRDLAELIVRFNKHQLTAMNPRPFNTIGLRDIAHDNLERRLKLSETDKARVNIVLCLTREVFWDIILTRLRGKPFDIADTPDETSLPSSPSLNGDEDEYEDISDDDEHVLQLHPNPRRII